jgi:anti-sigma factor RsiW
MSLHDENCRHARIAIGGEPHAPSAEVSAHLETCAACRQFLAETLALDGRVRAALEVPLTKFRTSAPSSARRFALAASVLLAMIAGAGFWLLAPSAALAGEVLEHVRHESGSWGAHEVLSGSALADVLQEAGVKFDTSMPVVYAMACPFRGRRVPHLVVQTADGPMTVMLLAHEKVDSRQEFSEDGYHGVLLPAGEGSVALLMQNGQVPEAVATEVVSGVRW